MSITKSLRAWCWVCNVMRSPVQSMLSHSETKALMSCRAARSKPEPQVPVLKLSGDRADEGGRGEEEASPLTMHPEPQSASAIRQCMARCLQYREYRAHLYANLYMSSYVSACDLRFVTFSACMLGMRRQSYLPCLQEAEKGAETEATPRDVRETPNPERAAGTNARPRRGMAAAAEGSPAPRQAPATAARPHRAAAAAAQRAIAATAVKRQRGRQASTASLSSLPGSNC